MPNRASDQDAAAATSTAEAHDTTGIKVPSDLSKVSDAKARELVDAGAVDDADLPAKMYKRKSDGFVARIPNYTFNAYSDVLKGEWDEIKLVTDPEANQG